jgi:hypothetical protein
MLLLEIHEHSFAMNILNRNANYENWSKARLCFPKLIEYIVLRKRFDLDFPKLVYITSAFDSYSMLRVMGLPCSYFEERSGIRGYYFCSFKLFVPLGISNDPNEEDEICHLEEFPFTTDGKKDE